MTDEPRHDPPPIPGELLDMLERARFQATDVLEEMIAEVEAARTVPLSTSVMVGKDDFRDKLQSVKDDLTTTLDEVVRELPEELRAARWMVRERESYVARTNEKAREVLAKAKTRADDMVAESSIVAEAVEEANRLVRNAENEGRRIRLEAEDHAEQRLAEAETILGEILGYLRDARSELHRSLPPSPEVPVSE
jgi:division protein CdvB (Snf7/Vps24/ESCRT-III family)